MAIGIKKIKVKIDGKDYSNIVPSDFASLSLSQGIEQPHSLTMIFSRDAFEKSNELAGSSISFLGKKIEINVKAESSELTKVEEELKFLGIITSISANVKNGLSSDSIVISAASPEIIMDDGNHTRSFEEMSISDVVSKVTGDYGLVCPVTVNPESTGNHEYIVQYQESSLEFLQRLARKYGHWFYYDGAKLTFGKAEKKEQIKLDVGKNLSDFQIKLNLQAYKFGLVAYDYADDGSQIYQSQDSNQNFTQSKKGKKVESLSNQIFTHESKEFYNHHLTKGNQQAHLDKRVKIKKSGKGSRMVMCSGQSDCPLLKPGVIVNVNEKSNSGNTSHGSYLIFEVHHSLDRNGEYTNSFSGVPSEIEYPFYSNPYNIPFCETQSAIVVENEDPDNFGRVRVRFFWEQDIVSPWIRIVNPYAGKEKGHMFIPEIDEEVLVGFEGGNAEKPYVIGSMYHAKAYPESWKPDNNDIKAIRTRSGHTIEFRDTDGEEEVWMYDYNKENYFIKLKTHAKEITIEAIEHIELKAKNITLKAEKDLNMEATDATLKAGGNIDNNASGNITTKASGNVSVEASSNAKLKGGVNTNIEAGAQIVEKAGMIKLN